MIKTGSQLRDERVNLGLSQARFAEISGLPQHLLSSFELEKAAIKDEMLDKINKVLTNLASFSGVTQRKKRYRSHEYEAVDVDTKRVSAAAQTGGNSDFLHELKSLEKVPKRTYSAVSLFSGIGGFSLGFRSAGFAVKGFVEVEDSLAAIYSENFPSAERLGADITQVDSEQLSDIRNEIGDVDVIIGGPPCQGFSLSGKRDIDDPRNYLFQDYLRVLDVLSPKVAVVENVRLLTSMKSKDGGFVKDAILDGLREHGYKAKLFEVNAKS